MALSDSIADKMSKILCLKNKSVKYFASGNVNRTPTTQLQQFESPLKRYVSLSGWIKGMLQNA